MGDTIHNLEILPPLGRPKSKIVEVEMPYSTKLLSQEQETYLNLTMRYITTSGVECLKPLEFSGTSSEVVKELPRLILPETVAPAYIEEVPKAVLTVEQLRTMGSQLQLMTEQERAVADTVLEDSPEGIQLEQEAQMNAMAQLQNTGQAFNIGEEATNQVTMPNQGLIEEQQGGMPIPSGIQQIGGMPLPNPPVTLGGEGPVRGPQVPGGGPVISVRTDAEAMMSDGLMGAGMMRQPRRNPFRNFNQMGGMVPMGPMGPQQQRYTPMEGGGSGGNITITKLE
jgi:hypothetical protein